MGLTEQRASAWKFIKSEIAKVQDKGLRAAMMGEFRKRALNEWGFNPDNGQLATGGDVVLGDWEREFVEDVQKTISFELDLRESKRDTETRTAVANMREFVRSGGQLHEIPDDIRTEYITGLYFDAVHWYGEQLKEAYDAATN